MSARPHAQWGLPIPDKHGLVRRMTPVADLELSGTRALQRISQVATQPDLAREIDVPTLQAASTLALDPATVRKFANPSIVTGCVELLKSAVGESRGVTSETPFSFEYGAGCFTIITICLDICLLERLNKLDEALATGENAPEFPAYGTLSIRAAMAVSTQLTILENGGDCDWILGWPAPNHTHCHTPLLSRSDASALMSMLWDNRWYILTIFGMSNVLFLLSRYVFHERYSLNNPDGQILHTQLYELAMRHVVAASKYHQVAGLQILDSLAPYKEWNFTSKHINTRDSRLILTTFISQISCDLEADFLAGRSPLMMLQFVVLATDPDSQDLLPKVMKSTIEYGWMALLHPGNDNRRLPEMVFRAL